MGHRSLAVATVVTALALTGCQPWPSSQDNQDAVSRRETYVARNASLPEETKNAILGGRITMGMSPGQVRVSWGTPDHTRTNAFAWGTTSTWWYGSTLVSFRNDKVDGWSGR